MELLSIEQGRTIRLTGELDMSNEPELDKVLQAAAEDGGPIMVDLSELTFIDSSGINALVRAAISLSDTGCLVLHGERNQVTRVLDLVQVDESVPNLHRVQHALRGSETAPSAHPRRSENGSERTPSRV